MKTTLDTVSFMVHHLDRDDIPAALKTILIDLHIPTDMKGFPCLVSAIQMHRTDPEQSLTKEIYPDVGQQMDQVCNSRQVEKLIRYAINDAWKKRDPHIWEQYFTPGHKPTNGEFIAQIAELLDLWQSCCINEGV